MNIQEFISRYNNHPVLFVGTGVSLRYLENAYTWDGLLEQIAYDLFENKELYYDIKAKAVISSGQYDYKKIAKELEHVFNDKLEKERHGKFSVINDLFYSNMEKGITQSRFKLYISELLKGSVLKPSMTSEINELKKVRKNIGSIITTNYDQLIETIFEFKPLIGNDILLSNPYGSIYKIHGCISDPSRIIITDEDYINFNEKYELIRAQLLSLFIHNPIIFIGYALGDDNIKSILKTIFTYIEPNTKEAEKIRNNFLLVEYEAGSANVEVTDHDIDMNGFSTIRINKIKTDNFTEIYKQLSNLSLSISAMDIRKVQAVVKEIYSGGNIKVKITENLDSLKNDEKVIAIGSLRTIKYEYQTASEMMADYFNIIEEENDQLLELINKHRLSKTQYFPIFAFSKIQSEIEKIDVLKEQQKSKINNYLYSIKDIVIGDYSSIHQIVEDGSISFSSKNKTIVKSIEDKKIELEQLEEYLKRYEDKQCTDYKRLLCYYDLKKYSV